MKSDNIILTKTFDFAVRIINLYKHLSANKKGVVVAKQLLRSGTSIGANTEEAVGAQTRKDFYSKFSIAYKEARESRYWIKLLIATSDLTEKESTTLLSDIDEINKIIASILFTTRKKIENE